MSSLTPDDVTPAGNTASSKRRRPMFRPATQRKTKGQQTTASETSTTTEKEPQSSTASTSEQEHTTTKTTAASVTDDTAGASPAAAPVATATAKRGRKRKASTGVAIGSSRPVREQDSALQEDGTLTTQPAVVTEPAVPSAAPGQVTLQAYCTKYRSKEKRPKAKAKPTNVSSDAAPTENAAGTGGPVVQVVNGEIVLQESSMVVPGARRSVQEVEEEFQQVVEEETHSALVGASYHSFVSRRAPQHWTVAETKLFYHALRQVGTDFATMVAYFDNRSRKQLKRKYQVESSTHPDLIALALNPKSQVPLDLSVFNVQVQAPASNRTTNEALPPALPSRNDGQDEETAEKLMEEAPPQEETLVGEGQNSQRTQQSNSIPLTPTTKTPPRSTRTKRPKFKATKTRSRAK